MTDPNPSAPDLTDVPAPDVPAPDFTPVAGDVVRLDDPELGGEPRFGLYVAEFVVVPLAGAQRYELQLYPAG